MIDADRAALRRALIEERDRRAEIRARCEGPGGLIEYIQLLWHVLEPQREFVRGWAIEAIAEHLESVTFGHIKKLLIGVPPGMMKSLSSSCYWPSWEWGPQNMPSMRYLCVSYSQGLTVRDNAKFLRIVQSEEFQKFWGDRFSLTKETVIKPENDKSGFKLASSVSGVGTGERADRVVVDDPNSIKTVESDIVRNETNRWFTEVMPTRVNSPTDSAFVVIQQRTHESDVTGLILSKEMGYEYCCIPMEYDSARHCVTVLAVDEAGNPTRTWDDPRTEDGELAFPERFTAPVVAQLKKDIGEYACNPYEAPVLMRDLSMRPIGEVRAGDEVIGFTTDTKPRPELDEAYKRRKLVTSTVKSVHKTRRLVVKIKLGGGQEIRCTADHKWYSDRAGSGGEKRPIYRQAKIGLKLIRVCPAALPILTREQERTAGWVAGFFDGEGSISVAQKQAHFQPRCMINFYQGADRNLHLCSALERALDDLGFPYSIYERRRPSATTASGDFPFRCYRLTGSRLPLCQKFLHVVRPHKWRDRLIEFAVGTDFMIGKETVLSIEPDGEEDVYALETTTGNYIVWGLASSNSAAQLQQLPAPRGGGIFKRAWWGKYPPLDHPERDTGGRINFPPFSYVVASLDTAFTEKQENDPCALTIWGTWRQTGEKRTGPQLVTDGNQLIRMDDDQRSKIMLMYGWKKHLSLHGPPVPPEADIADVYCEERGCYALPGTRHSAVCRVGLKIRQKYWGVVEWTVHACRNYRIDHLLIEAKANGIDVVNELRRLYANEDWGVEMIDPKGDKVARANSVVHLVSNGGIYVPEIWIEREKRWAYPDWAETCLSDFSIFPRGGRDVTDTMTQALQHLRARGLAVRTDEQDAAYEDSFRAPGRPAPLYPA